VGELTKVKLCIQCVHRWAALPQIGGTQFQPVAPCGRFPEWRLVHARAECDGDLWEARIEAPSSSMVLRDAQRVVIPRRQVALKVVLDVVGDRQAL